MSIEIVTIGDEILSGITVNTNSAFISQQLTDSGWVVARHTSLQDNPSTLLQGLEEALHRSNVLILTGGLGPTGDDVTRSALSTLFASPCIRNEHVAQELSLRFGSNLASLNDQATIPKKALPLINAVGTAPGLVFHENNKIVVALPGVPQEMGPMLTKQVLPYLQAHTPPTHALYRSHFYLCLITEDAVDPLIRTWKKTIPEVNIGIYPSYGILHICLSSKDKQALTLFSKHLQEAFQNNLFPSTTGLIEEAVHNICIHLGKSLALAESCTGGSMAAALTNLPGSSAYFLGSLVTYSNAMKEKILGVPKNLIEQHGAVSKEIVDSMLSGLFQVTSADYGIAVSGIAGPTGATTSKPVGTVWIALGTRQGPIYSGLLSVKGNSREKIILSAKNRAFSHFFRYIKYNITPSF